MKKIYRKFAYLLPLALVYGCEPEFEDLEFSQGGADFSRTVAVGNSLTAGFQNGALRRQKQEVSMPAMVAEQLQQVGGGSFNQPLLPAGPGIGPAGNAALSLALIPNCEGEVSPSPVPLALQGQTSALGQNIGSQGPFNNIGVPGAKLIHLNVAGYGSSQGNPFFARFATNPNQTMLQAATAANPTFFMLWIGNNDVLSYATGGGEESGDQITPTTNFNALYSGALSTLMAGGAKGVVANIPDITSIPYFTTVPSQGLVLDAQQASQLNLAIAQYNQLVQLNLQQGNISQQEADLRSVTFNAGPNGFLIKDSSLTQLYSDFVPPIDTAVPRTFFRQIKPDELLTLLTPQDSLRCFGLGSVDQSTGTPIPIQENLVLDREELAKIRIAIGDFNEIIRNAANTNGLAFVNANVTLKELSTSGITVNGIDFSSEFVTGGAFSLDGIHPSTRGYAIVANGFIDAINATYSAQIPKVTVTDYDAIDLP